MFPSSSLVHHLGYTLIEVVVVLVLLVVAAAVVGPSLLVPNSKEGASMHAVLGAVREAAVRRAEFVRLQIDRTGTWRAMAGASPDGELLLTGRLSNIRQGTASILFSPLGTCAFAPETTPSEELAGLDPLTCEVRTR